MRKSLKWLGIFGLVGFGVAAWLAAPSTALATELPSTITSNTTLTTAGSPYTGSPTIESGTTLTIKPGVELTLGGLTVKGTLMAEGTSEGPIVFRPVSKGFKWAGVVFKPGSGSSVLEHVEVVEAGNSGEAAIAIDESSPRITHSVVTESTHYGISIKHGGASEVDHSTISHSGSMGILYHEPVGNAGAVNIHDNSLDHNGGSAAIYVEISGSAGENIVGGSLGGNTLTKNSSTEALYCNGGQLPPDIADNTLLENYGNHMTFGGWLEKSATWTDHGVPLFISNLHVETGSTLVVKEGVTFRGGAFLIDGTLKAEGSAEDPIFFKRQSEVSQYRGLIFEPGSGASVLEHVEVIEGGYGSEAAGAIVIDEASPRITQSVVRNSGYWGIQVKHGGAPEIDHNTISANNMGVVYAEASGNVGEVNIHDNSLDHNYGSAALYVEISGSAGENVNGGSLGDNTLTENSSTSAISYNGGELPPDIGGNTVSGNYDDHITLSGIWAESGIWTPHGPPVHVGSIEIAEGKTMSVEAGTVFEGGTITVKGTLKAEGTAEEPVLFKSQNGSSWRGLIFKPSSGASVLDHVEVAGAGLDWEGAVTIDESSPTITNSTIRQSAYTAIWVRNGGSPEIADNVISHSGNAGIVYAEPAENSGEINIHDNYVDHASWAGAIYVEISGSAGEDITATSLGGNTLIENGSGAALSYHGGEVPPDIDDNLVQANVDNYISLSGNLEQTATWSDPGVPIRVGGALVIPEGATLNLTEGLAFEGGSFFVEGTLHAQGSAEEPVTFQPLGSSTWNGITFESGSGASLLDYVEVIQGGATWGAAISMLESSPTITHSTIRKSGHYGIYVSPGSSPTIEWNIFRQNNYSVLYEGEGELSAPHNDWGCIGGPKSEGCGGNTWHVDWEPAAFIGEVSRPCVAGSLQPGPSVDCLLYRYQPELLLDSTEDYHPDSVAMMVENWGNAYGLWSEDEEAALYGNGLRDYDEPWIGEYVARAGPGQQNGDFHLSLRALGASYPNKHKSDGNDWLVENGSLKENYAEVAQELEAHGFKDRSYGILLEDESHKIWLQYWYFYYYNSKAEVGFGLHEGDWEMVEIGLDSEFKPEVVVLSQHSEFATCDIEEMEETEAGGPVVYVARESHANYPEAGTYETPPVGPHNGTDGADGEGDVVVPTLENLGFSQPSWLEWEGHWGHSRGFPSESPQGPEFHGAWDSPDGTAESGHGCLSNQL
ncbi:MAG TPA: right-handed parallel beta-helix repeat-containing protein [Solirubrobacterales bacterium]